jgi:hypothetical protein
MYTRQPFPCACVPHDLESPPAVAPKHVPTTALGQFNRLIDALFSGLGAVSTKEVDYVGFRMCLKPPGASVTDRNRAIVVKMAIEVGSCAFVALLARQLQLRSLVPATIQLPELRDTRSRNQYLDATGRGRAP